MSLVDDFKERYESVGFEFPTCYIKSFEFKYTPAIIGHRWFENGRTPETARIVIELERKYPSSDPLYFMNTVERQTKENPDMGWVELSER